MEYSLYSKFTAFFLLICAAISQSIQGYPDPTTVSFLFVGVTSVIHHSRLDEWWKKDIWRILDYLAILIFIIFATYRFRKLLEYYIIALIVILITLSIWIGLIPYKYIPFVHGIMHIIIGLSILIMIIQSVDKN